MHSFISNGDGTYMVIFDPGTDDNYTILFHELKFNIAFTVVNYLNGGELFNGIKFEALEKCLYKGA